MIKYSMKINGLWILLAPLLFVVCTKDYNPFEDSLNAEAQVIYSSFASGDTLGIFSSETLQVAIAAAELVDSITVRCSDNRFFADDTTLIPNAGSFTFILSFYDTGMQTVEITTWRSVGDEISSRMDVFVTSPLSQSTVTGTYDEEVQLRTAGVGDGDVLYHWDFGKGAPVQSPYPETLVVIRESGHSDTGWLWVSDVQGAHWSPKVAFTYSLLDTIGPLIQCVNEEYAGSDTIATGSSTFFFKVEVTDRGRGGVHLAEIDGGSFDIVEDPLYVKIYHQMDTFTGVMPVRVYAVDNADDYNSQSKTFYLRYNSTISSGSENVDLFIRIPSTDSVVSYTRQRYVFGTLENYRRDTLVLTLEVNDSTYESKGFGSAFSHQWDWPIFLTQASNTVTIQALDTSGGTIDDTTFTMLYDSEGLDDTPPVILEVTVDGDPAHGKYVEEDTVTLRIIAFDEGSGLASLTVQGKSSVAGQMLNDYLWPVQVQLSHATGGTVVEITATDNKGLSRDTSVTLFQNRAPQVSVKPDPPYPVFVGSTYTDRISADDADGDMVVYRLASPLAGFILDSLSGAIRWTPTIDDTGTVIIKINVTDRLETQVVRCTITVVDSTEYGEPIAFTVSEQSFPSFVEGGVDNVIVPLSVTGGVAPFTYKAERRVGSSGENVSLSDTTFVWAPDTGDTGYQHFIITVTDKYQRADTLYPIIHVVPPNRPCSLSVAADVDTLADGSVDLSASAVPETLTYTIGDPDPLSAEQYTVVIRFDGREDIRTVQGVDTFLVIVDPDAQEFGTDSITVIVEDRGGNADTLTTVLYYGEDPRFRKKIILNTSSSGANISGEDLYDFPVLVRVDTSMGDFDSVRSDSAGLRFLKADSSYLSHHIEEWNPGLNRCIAWVLVDTIFQSNASQYIQMVGGESGGAYQSNSETVFSTSNGFVSVWHFGGNDLNDATVNSHDCTNEGTTSAAGLIGSARNFSNGDRMKVNHSPDFNTQTITFSMWIKLGRAGKDWNDNQPRLIDKTPSIGPIHSAFQVALDREGPFTDEQPGFRIGGRGADPTEARVYSTSSALNPDTAVWQYVTVVTTSGTTKLYANAVLDTSVSGLPEIQVNAEPIYIGNSPELVRDYHGFMDEIRFCNVSRSASWVKLCYENQKPESDFTTIVGP